MERASIDLCHENPLPRFLYLRSDTYWGVSSPNPALSTFVIRDAIRFRIVSCAIRFLELQGFSLLGIAGLWYDKKRFHAQEGGGRMTSQLGRFAVISDIHGNLPALNAVLDDARSRGISEFVFAGDYCLSGPFPDECIATLMSQKHIGDI